MALMIDLGVAVEQHYSVIDATRYTVSNDKAVATAPPRASFVLSEATAAATADLSHVPPRALVTEAKFLVTADPPGTTVVENVAQVRKGTPDDATQTAIVVDFQGMRTVAGIGTVDGLPLPDLAQVHAWIGTKFENRNLLTTPIGFGFAEVQTERLRLVFSSAVTEAAVKAAAVSLPAPPADLEITVNGARAWHSPVATARKNGAAHAFEQTVDLTAAIRDAFETGTAAVELRSSSPATLAIQPTITFFNTHAVAFPDGPARTVDAEAEGEYTIDLPLPGGAGWQIHRVEARVSGEPGGRRVVPPAGPEISDAAELLLRGEHTLFVGLAAPYVARLQTLTAVRVPLRTGDVDAEVTGVLHGAAGSGPGEPLPGAALAPVIVPAGQDPAAYVTLPLAEPLELEPEAPLWLALFLTRGTAVWPLAQPATPATLNSELRRRSPSGVHRPLTRPEDLPPPLAAIRLVGDEHANAPIPALRLAVEGRDDHLLFSPTRDGAAAGLKLAQPISPQEQQAGPADALRLSLLVGAPATYRIDSIRVVYRDPTPTGGAQ